MGLQQFEQRLERLVEGAFAKAFRGELQPIELGRRLTREMDLHRSVSVRGFIAPNVYKIELSQSDYDRFASLGDALINELEGAIRDHARLESYKFIGPVHVETAVNERHGKSTLFIHTATVESSDGQAGSLVLSDGRHVTIGLEPLTIGRTPECDIPIADPNVSRQHAQILRDGDSVVVVDLKSTNGTRVNGMPIDQHFLVDGEIITIGLTSMRFEAL